MEKLALSFKAIGAFSGVFAIAEFFYQDMVWTALTLISSLCFAIGSNVWSVLRVRKMEQTKHK